jgi:hypothetical protein
MLPDLRPTRPTNKKNNTTLLKSTITILLMLTALSAFSQNAPSCAELKSGIFYFYQKNSADRYIIYRADAVQKEVNVQTGDSTFWELQWIDDCSYSLKIKSTSVKLSPEAKKMAAEHKLVYTIKKITAEYYTYQSTIDKPSNLKLSEDTMWLSEKTGMTDNTLFKQVRNVNEIRKLRDTSKYAVLYIYRPGKITNSMGNYLIFFDNVPMAVASNSSGFIFKIFKEGKFPVSSRLFKDDSTVDIDIKFGQVYYVKSMIHWGISSRLYNFKLEIAKVTNELGEKEFENIKNR